MQAFFHNHLIHTDYSSTYNLYIHWIALMHLSMYIAIRYKMHMVMYVNVLQ